MLFLKKLSFFIKRALQRLLGAFPAYHKYYINYLMKEKFIENYDFLNKSQWFSAEKIASYQQEKLSEMIRYSYKNVPYYKDLFDREGIDPGEIRTVEDLRKIPIVDKYKVRDQPEDFRASGYEQFNPKTNKTSGSTGTPFKILVDQAVVSFVHAVIWRHYNWAGCRFHDKSVYMGPPFDYETGEIDLKNLYQLDSTGKILKLNTGLMNKETLPELCRLLEDFKPDHIHAYPSIISIFAQYLLKNKSYEIRPESVILRAEKVYPEHRDLVKSAFGCPCFELYAMYEYITFASECDHHSLHLNEEMGITEIIKDGKPCAPGEVGEIVGTTLLNHSMPLIRYAMGDYGRIKKETCACGRQSPILEVTGSRAKDLIVTEKGYFNVMSGVPLIIEGVNEGINHVQFYQKDMKNLIIRLVKKDKAVNLDESQIKKRVGNYFRNSINISIEYVDSIARTKSGKYKYVDSEVPLEI
ncbi:MAG: phenylacetate--CoA ligase family protein [Candidatus Omnitrophica bacterium]|nr:phenylacetate--CoA ligase family protein [Candidatus Omnitrophota bacterium]